MSLRVDVGHSDFLELMKRFYAAAKLIRNTNAASCIYSIQKGIARQHSSLKEILEQFKAEKIPLDSTVSKLIDHFDKVIDGNKSSILSVGNYAKIDLSRQSRAGFPEVLFLISISAPF